MNAPDLERRQTRFLYALAGVAGLWLTLLTVIVVFSLAAVLGVVSQLKSFTDPHSCITIFSRYSNSVNRWDLKRDNARVHGFPDPPRPTIVASVPRDEHEVYAPELLPGHRCTSTYRHLQILLPQ